MKREAFDHPKIKLLARDLGLPLCFARGIVESLWVATGINFPRGDIGRWTDDEIAVAIDYPGDPGLLIAALIKRKLLDRIADEAGRLYIHDWHEHCGRYVYLRVLRSSGTFADGTKAGRRKDESDGDDERSCALSERTEARAERAEAHSNGRAHTPSQTASASKTASASRTASRTASGSSSAAGKQRREEPVEKLNRQPDPIWDAVASGYFEGTVAHGQKPRVGKLVRDLRELGASGPELGVRRRRLRELWGAEADTPEALVKHWTKFGAELKPENAMTRAAARMAAEEAHALHANGQ